MTVVGAIVVAIITIEDANGLFTPWKYLGKPPGKVVRIVAPDYALMDTGAIYEYNATKNCSTGCWDKVEKVQTYEDPEAIPADNNCAIPYLVFFKQTVILCDLWGPGSSTAVYGLGMDGYIYVWSNEFGEGNTLEIVISPFLGAALGFVIGIVVILLRTFWPRKKRGRVPNEVNLP